MTKINYDDENYFFSSDELMEYADEIKQRKDLNICEEGETMILEIAEHFEFCPKCRENFDAMRYENYNRFEKLLSYSNEPFGFICDWQK